jgi:outer membrane murein-binding lipoprotein Lpp
MKCAVSQAAVALVVATLLGVTLIGGCQQRAEKNSPSKPAQETTANGVPALQADVATLKDRAPDQAHAMIDVDYHFTNLWFAGRAENWSLAKFYWGETVSHMRWAVRIIPVRKDTAGHEIKLQDILQSIEQSPLMQVGKTIEEKDVEKFETAYRYMLEGCYSCHKASDKPYLRPQIPERPASSIINFDPKATWPK